jgi:hypothetical protein
MESQLDRLEKKIDCITEMMMALLDSISEEDETDDGERDQTQPL